jgi:F0F1-type ATP synthase membrane subunit b/b'
MDALSQLGINLVNIVIYSLLFLVIYIILSKFVLKGFIETLEKRQQAIKDNESLGQNLNQQKEKLAADVESTIKEAKLKARETVNLAIKEAKEEKTKIIDSGKKEAELIIEKANSKLEVEREKLNKEMEGKIELAAKKALMEIYQTDKVEIDKKLIELVIKEM